MPLSKLHLTILLAVLMAAGLPCPQHLGFAPFALPKALAQTQDARKAEAERWFQQGNQQYDSRQFQAAMQSWQRALALYRTLGDREGEAQSLNSLGLTAVRLKQYQPAIELYQQSFAISQQINSLRGQSTSLYNLAKLYDALGQYKQAIEFFQQSLVFDRALGDREGELLSLSKVGLAYFSLEQYEQAIEFFQQTLTLSQQLGNRQGEAASLHNLSNAYKNLSQYQQSIEFSQQSLPIYQEIGNRQGELFSLGNLGIAYASLGKYRQAVTFFQQSLAISKETGNRLGEAFSLGYLGNAYASLGQYQQAITFFQQSLTISKEIGRRGSEASILGNLGTLHIYLGQYPQAIAFLQQSLAIERELGYRGKEAISLHNLGTVYSELGEKQQALELYQQVLAIAQEIGERELEAASLNNLGEIYRNLEQNQQAIERYQQALTLARKIGNLELEAASLSNLGLIYASSGQYQPATDRYQQALAITRETGHRVGEAISLTRLGAALLESGNLAAAAESLLAAIQVSESLRQSLSDTNKISLFEIQQGPYQGLQEVLVAQNRSDEALEIAERGRARAFVELLAKRLSGNPEAQSNVESLSLSQIQNIARTQNATLVEYSILGSVAQKKAILYSWVVQPTGKIHFRSMELENLALPLNELIPETRQSLGVRHRDPRSQPAPSPRLAFAPGNWVRLHSDAPDSEPWEVVRVDPQSGTLSLTQSSFPQGVTIERSTSDVVAKVETRRAKNLRLQQLHQVLIDPIADLLPADPAARVIFMPQRELFLVPFPALQDAQGTYLIEKHTILTAPAIQVLDLTRQRRQRLTANTPHSSSVFRPPSSVLPSPSSVLPSPSNLLIVGNPTMPKIAWVPGDPPQPLTALPHAEQEARAIAQLLQTTALTGNQATKAAVLAKLPAARVIHLATHGLLDDRRGLGSAIALAPAAGDDGLLTAEEILDLNLKAELVVLSACNTGKGRITGDGVIGLSRALINAGVPSVIVSLWTVPDAPTAALMTAFYKNLQQDGDKARALRQAMLTTLQHHPDPRDWAAFTLIGEAE